MMKRLLFLFIVLGLAVWVFAKSVNTTFTDAVSATDTVITTKRFDTTFTPWASIEGAQKLHFYTRLINDTNWTADSFWVSAQFSIDQKFVTKTIELDTFVATDSGWSGNDALAADSIRGEYMRGRLIHYDSAEAKLPAVKNYNSDFILWYAIIK